VVNTTAVVTPGYLAPWGTRMSEIGIARVTRGRGQSCRFVRPSNVGGIRETAALLMFTPKHAVLMIDAGIPPSAKRRT
jgi:hypothetical protein